MGQRQLRRERSISSDEPAASLRPKFLSNSRACFVRAFHLSCGRGEKGCLSSIIESTPGKPVFVLSLSRLWFITEHGGESEKTGTVSLSFLPTRFVFSSPFIPLSLSLPPQFSPS